MDMQIWTIDRQDARPSTWWWWFWLFFIKGGKNPRQLMILWSTKNCPQIKVNHLPLTLNHDLLKSTGNQFHGAVASWYYDGKKMHDNFVLEECNLTLNGNGIESDAGTYSSIQSGNKFKTKIEPSGTKMEFLTEQSKNAFAEPISTQKSFFNKFNFKFQGINHLNLSGSIDGKKIDGSAYFQKVQVNAPSAPWFWGLAHFDTGSALTYFFPYLGTAIFNKTDTCRYDTLKLPLSRLIRFFDGKKIHEFDKARIKEIQGGETPTWGVSSKKGPGIKFTVETYSRSYWRFEEKKWLRNVLYYNEYPMKITEFKMGDLSLDDLGDSMGNAEHTWGRLL